MATTDKLLEAFALFDKANAQDPNTELYNGKEYPKEVLYGIRMTDKLNMFLPEASESLQLAARCQHIKRWEIARDSYPMDRVGYLKWRQDLKKFHASEASKILQSIEYDHITIEEVSSLLQKKRLKKNPDTQALEDVICLVFLEFYFEPFAAKHSDEKTIDIVQKTWRKMSQKGHNAALKLPLSQNALALVQSALKDID